MITAPYTWIEISKSAFEHNIAQYRALPAQGIELGVVVKSNAYGHGLQNIAQLCEELPAVTWLYTTSLSEALALRAAGIKKNLLAMAIIDGDPAPAIEQSVDFVVNDQATLHLLNARGKELNTPARVHIKIDTGMSRFGLLPADAPAFIRHAQKLPYITVTGLFTHLAESDSPDQTFTQNQIDLFNQVVKDLGNDAAKIPFKHASNSAGAASLDHGYSNLVRLGAGAYGLWPSQALREKVLAAYPGFSLKPVMAWKTTIMQVRSIAADKPVGYARTHVTTAPTQVALLPVGYYEGYDRRLSNKGRVLVKTTQGESVHAPVIGRVCMNVTMVDVSHVPDVRVGDEVTLLGASEHTSATAIANTMASYNPREFISRLHPAIMRKVVD